MAKSKSRSKKRKAGGPQTPPPLRIGSSDDDRVLFLLIDWRSEQSIRNHIPVPDGFDQINLVPKAWLALDANPRGIVFRAKLWRCLSKEEQEEQAEKAKIIGKNTQQMKKLKGNLDMLETTRRELIEGDATWEEVAEEPTEFLDSLPEQRLRAAAGATAMEIIVSSIKTFSVQRVLGTEQQTTSSTETETATSDDDNAPDNTTTPIAPPLEPRK